VNLYFKRFEFNASIYYVVRWFGYQIKGYNIIGTAGIRLAYIPVLFIFMFSIFKTKSINVLITKMLFSISIYFFTATIIHPWYVVTLVCLSVFTNYRYTVLWSGLAVLSYATYRDTTYQEILWLNALEYVTVYAFFFYELYRNGIFTNLQSLVLQIVQSIKKPSV